MSGYNAQTTRSYAIGLFAYVCRHNGQSHDVITIISSNLVERLLRFPLEREPRCFALFPRANNTETCHIQVILRVLAGWITGTYKRKDKGAFHPFIVEQGEHLGQVFCLCLLIPDQRLLQTPGTGIPIDHAPPHAAFVFGTCIGAAPNSVTTTGFPCSLYFRMMFRK